LAYATAGAASAFACAYPHLVEATIHYSGPINRIFKFDHTSTFQLDQPDDFIRLIHRSGTNYAGYDYFGVGGKAGASIAGFYCEIPFLSASNLERGQLISSRPFAPAQSATLARACCSPCHGQFAERGRGYIGFKFNNGSGDQYGWVRIQARGNFTKNFLLRDYAYGDVGDQIRAGQTSSNEMPADEGSLGWLALGAAGVLAWRKSRSIRGREVFA